MMLCFERLPISYNRLTFLTGIWPFRSFGELVASYDLIVLAKANIAHHNASTGWMTQAIAQQLYDYVESGGSLLALHSGLSRYDNFEAMCDLLGGEFIGHPEPCTVRLVFDKRQHLPIGLTDFEIHDEHYQVRVFGDESNIFCSTRSRHGTQPSGWKHRLGKGKVIAFTPCHFVNDLLSKPYQAALKGLIQWLLEPLSEATRMKKEDNKWNRE